MGRKRTKADKAEHTLQLPPAPAGAGLVVYEGATGQVPVAIDEIRDAVWLSFDQIGRLHGRHKATVSRHLGAIFKGRELDREGIVAFLATASCLLALRREAS